MAGVNESYSNMFKFVSGRFQLGKEYDVKKFRRKWFDSANNLYCKNFQAHHGCVNAVEFSDDGNLLFSGGDDRRVLVWKVDAAILHNAKPTPMLALHYSNIFCLAVDSVNNRIFSGSNDDQVIVHDYTTGSPVDTFLHASPVFCISLQPSQPCVFTSAGENGRVLLFDIRDPNADPLCIAQQVPAFHGVMFHPVEPVLFATANAKMGIDVWDIRKPKVILQHCCDDQGMAVRWNSRGSLLLCIRNLLPPLLVDPMKPHEQLEFDAESYYNACTMKSCCFAGDNDEYILSGSDDFNVHMWKIPEPWPTNRWVSKTHLTLKGHRSIVNQVRYCPQRQLIVSSGVEKLIKLWSPYPMPGCSGDRDKQPVARGRLMCSAAMCRRGRNLFTVMGEESVNEDGVMLHFFDSLLRNEFADRTRPFSPPQPTPSHYELLVQRKKKFLARTLTETEPFVCTLREEHLPTSSDSDDVLFSDDSGMSRMSGGSTINACTDSSSSSSSSSSSGSSSSSTPPAPKDSGVNISQSSEEEEGHGPRWRGTRCYRIRRRKVRASTDTQSHSTGSEEDTQN